MKTTNLIKKEGKDDDVQEMYKKDYRKAISTNPESKLSKFSPWCEP